MSDLIVGETKNSKRIISLYEICKLMNKEHRKWKVNAEEMHQMAGFGEVEKMTTSNSNNVSIETYYYTEKQSLMIGARLNPNKIITLVEKIEELKKVINKPMTFEEVMKNALLLADEKVKQLETKIEKSKPLVEFANTVADSSDVILVREYAKLLYAEEGIKIGQNKLYKWFRENGYLNKNNEPFQNYMDYFKVIETTTTSIFGTRINKTTKITGRGQVYFLAKLKEQF